MYALRLYISPHTLHYTQHLEELLSGVNQLFSVGGWSLLAICEWGDGRT